MDIIQVTLSKELRAPENDCIKSKRCLWCNLYKKQTYLHKKCKVMIFHGGATEFTNIHGKQHLLTFWEFKQVQEPVQ